MSEFKLIYSCEDYEEWLHITSIDESRDQHEGYRVRLTDNGVYKPGEIYDRYFAFVNKIYFQHLKAEIQKAFFENSLFLKALKKSDGNKNAS